MPRKLIDKDITSPNTEDNETWNTCPFCHKTWKDEFAIPHVLYRTVTCKDCIAIAHGKRNK